MDNLRKLRKERGIKQDEIAKYLKISVSAYSNYETGIRNVNIDTLIKLVKYFEVSADYLIGIIDEPISVDDCQKALKKIKDAKEKKEKGHQKMTINDIDPDIAVNKLKEILKIIEKE